MSAKKFDVDMAAETVNMLLKKIQDITHTAMTHDTVTSHDTADAKNLAEAMSYIVDAIVTVESADALSQYQQMMEQMADGTVGELYEDGSMLD